MEILQIDHDGTITLVAGKSFIFMHFINGHTFTNWNSYNKFSFKNLEYIIERYFADPNSGAVDF